MGAKEQLITEDDLSRASTTQKDSSDCVPAIRTWASSHLGWFTALVVYTAFGGLIFRELEYPGEIARLEEMDKHVRHERRNLIKALTNSSHEEHLTDQLLASYESTVQEVASKGLLLPLSHGVQVPLLARWSYLQAVFFASTVLTTIGYGNITPSTIEGRLFCIVFALVGIPLTVSVLADLGSLLASSLPNMPEARGLKGSLAYAALATSILLVYIAIGSAVFIFWERHWTFFDGFYFCFVTMTTIGFGDLVPSTPQYMLACTFYILFGLSLTSTIIEVVRQQYSQSWRHLQALAETLSQLAAEHQPPDVQADLRKMVTVINFTREKRPKDWQQAVKQLSEELHKQSEKPKVVQIFIYETSV